MDFVKIVDYIPYLALLTWLVYSIRYVKRAKKDPSSVNKYVFEMIPQIFTTIGILGTFIGIAVGLYFFDVNNIEDSIPTLLNGLKTAFIASIFGIIFYIVFSKWTAYVQNTNEKGKLSQEALILNDLVAAVSNLKSDLNEIFTTTDANNNKIKTANILRDVYSESQKQSAALQTFSTDLAIKIEAGFDTILTTQIEKGVIPELQSVRKEIEALGNKLKDPTTEMTQNVVSDLQAALGKMIEEFKTSVSGSTKSELENLATLLGQAGGSLTSFPARLQEMTDNLDQNFRGLQTVVQKISQQTLSQSTESTEMMKKQVEEMSEILKNKVGDLQNSQEVLITKQTQSITASDQLLAAFNSSIERMNGLSGGINETINKFQKVQLELSNAAGQLTQISNTVNSSSYLFKNAQLQFAEQNNVFLAANKKTIEEVQLTLAKAKEVSADYTQKFSVIEGGLQSIFEQIQEGLDKYTNTVGSSLESYLGKYSMALTKTAESLAGASKRHEDILEELTEQLSILNSKKARV